LLVRGGERERIKKVSHTGNGCGRVNTGSYREKTGQNALVGVINGGSVGDNGS